MSKLFPYTETVYTEELLGEVYCRTYQEQHSYVDFWLKYDDYGEYRQQLIIIKHDNDQLPTYIYRDPYGSRLISELSAEHTLLILRANPA